MKLARFWLLIVLALLLPLRGALAQVLPCTGGHGEPVVQALEGHRAALAHAAGPHGHAVGHAHSDADSGPVESASAGDDHPGQCSACASCCTGVPVPSLAGAVVPEPASCATRFPSWSAPVPGVVPERLDRPPCLV